MKKKMLAAAMAGTLACGTAMAESGLTLYGNIDASIVTASGIGTGSDRRTSFGEGNWAPSVWGVKGTEDLGSGTKAHFRLEGGFSAGTGSIANGGTTGVLSRMANVGLSGPIGSLTAGLNLSPFIAAYTSTLGLAGNNFYVPALLMHRSGTVLNSLGATVPVYPGGTDADPALGTTGGFFIPNSVTYSLPAEMLAGFTASVVDKNTRAREKAQSLRIRQCRLCVRAFEHCRGGVGSRCAIPAISGRGQCADRTSESSRQCRPL